MLGRVKVILQVPLLKAQRLVASDLPKFLQLGQNLFPFQVLQLFQFLLLPGLLLRVGERFSIPLANRTSQYNRFSVETGSQADLELQMLLPHVLSSGNAGQVIGTVCLVPSVLGRKPAFCALGYPLSCSPYLVFETGSHYDAQDGLELFM